MRRFLGLWLLLTPVLAIATFGVSIGVYRRIDVRFDVFLRIALVPMVQAAVLALLDGGAGRLRTRLAAAWSRRSARALFAGGGIAIAGATALSLGEALGSWRGSSLLLVAVALALAAAAVLLALARQGDRGLLLAGALWLCLLAASSVVPWLGWLAERAPGPPLLRWLMVHGSAWLLTIELGLRVGAALDRRCAGAGSYLDAAVAVAFAGGLVVALGFLLRFYLVSPWDVIAPALLASSALATLAGVLAALETR
jgi:hypothetical protein